MTQKPISIDGQEGEPLRFDCNTPTRYVITCLATGMRTEFDMQAGQSFTVVRGKSHVKVDIHPPTVKQQPDALEALQPPAGFVH